MASRRRNGEKIRSALSTSDAVPAQAQKTGPAFFLLREGDRRPERSTLPELFLIQEDRDAMSLNRYAFLALHFVIPAALVVGCVTRKTDTDNQVNTGSSGNTTSSSTGAGGAGGGGQGGAGGGVSCVDATGTGKTAAVCDQLNIAPAMGASQQCGPNMDEDPPGYTACGRAYTIFIAGAAEYFSDCLSAIEVGMACDATLAQTCLTDTIEATCDAQAIADVCTSFETQCGSPIEQVQCAHDLRPFSNAGLTELADCINTADPMLTCQEAFDLCYATVLPL